MQNIPVEKSSQDEKAEGNFISLPCNPTSSPAKTKHVEASHVSMGTQKPAFILVQENGVVKAKKVLQVVKVVKPQVPACIKARDVSSLLDQFLEYEQKQSSSVVIVKGSSVTLTPASSPSHLNKTSFTGHDSGSNQLVISPNGPTPPVSPPLSSQQEAIKTHSPSKNVILTKTPTKSTAGISFAASKNGNTKNTSMCSPSKASNSDNVSQKIVFKISPSSTSTDAANLTKNIKIKTEKSLVHKKATLEGKSPNIITVKPITALVSKDKVAQLPKRAPSSIPANTENPKAMEVDDNSQNSKTVTNYSRNNVFPTQKIKMECEVGQFETKGVESTFDGKSFKAEVAKEISKYDGCTKCPPSKQEKTQNPRHRPNPKIPEVYRKRYISSDSSDDEDKSHDDYHDFKRKKYKKDLDECYWSTSDEDNDDGRIGSKKNKKRRELTQGQRSRDSKNNLDNKLTSKRSYKHGKYDQQHSRSRSPSYDSEDERQQKRYKKSPPKEDVEESNVHLYDIENERKKNFKLDRATKETSTEKRKIVYIGNIDDSMTKSDIWSKFRKYGPIEKITVHYRKDGDNYSFVTFVDSSSALEAIEEGKANPDLKHLDICFGGRRKFCGGSYVDFDSTTSSFEEQQEKEGSRKISHSNEEMDFDTLLKMALKNKKR